MTTSAPGTVEILHANMGDVKLSFDPANKVGAEATKAKVTSMLRQGYAILVEVGSRNGEPVYQRAKAFDPDTCEYLIVGEPHKENGWARAGKAITRVAAKATRAVSVAPMAGG